MKEKNFCTKITFLLLFCCFVLAIYLYATKENGGSDQKKSVKFDVCQFDQLINVGVETIVSDLPIAGMFLNVLNIFSGISCSSEDFIKNYVDMKIDEMKKEKIEDAIGGFNTTMSNLNLTGNYKRELPLYAFYMDLTNAEKIFMKNDLYTGLPFFCQYVFMRLAVVKMLTKMNETRYNFLNDKDARKMIDAGIKMTKMVPKRFRTHYS